MKKLLIATLFLSILIISSCADDSFDYDCTDCTFFYCEVDGEEYTPNCNTGTIGFGCSARDARYSHPHPFARYIYIYIKNENRDENIQLNSKNVREENEYYPLFSSTNERSFTTFYRGSAECKKYRIDTTSTSDRLYITEIDTINWIIAGEFNFTGFNECTGDPVHITNGKFRLKYTY